MCLVVNMKASSWERFSLIHILGGNCSVCKINVATSAYGRVTGLNAAALLPPLPLDCCAFMCIFVVSQITVQGHQ